MHIAYRPHVRQAQPSAERLHFHSKSCTLSSSMRVWGGVLLALLVSYAPCARFYAYSTQAKILAEMASRPAELGPHVGEEEARRLKILDEVRAS